MLTIIIPAHNEAPYLNRTIDNLIRAASIRPEIVVIDQGGNGDIDPRAKVIRFARNVGERVAMNLAAKAATNEFLLRIDAHCDFTPSGFDVMLCEVTGERDLTMAVLTALRKPWDQTPEAEQQEWLASYRAGELWTDPRRSWKELSKAERIAWCIQKRTREDWQDWCHLPGHWYGQTRLVRNTACPACGAVVPIGGGVFEKHKVNEVPCSGSGQPIPPGSILGMEAKWHDCNRDHRHGILPTMGATGCGMCIRKSFYDQIGGADEDLPPMGAIGEEMAIKTWAAGGKCQLHCGVTIGHIFETGGYNTPGVTLAQQMLNERYGSHFDALDARPEFAGWNEQKGRSTLHITPDVRTVIVRREDVHDTKDDQTGKLLRRRIERFRYVWLSSEHPTETHLTDKQIEDKYAPLAVKVGQEIVYFDEQGNPVQGQEVAA